MRFDQDMRNHAEARRGYALAMTDCALRLEVALRMADALKALREECVAAGFADASGFEWPRVMSGAKDALAEWGATR